MSQPKTSVAPRAEAKQPSQDAKMAERYGTRRGRATTYLVAGLGGAVLAVIVGAVIWGGLQHAQPEVSSRLLTYKVASDNAVHVRFQVDGDPGTTARCELRAGSPDAKVVGTSMTTVSLRGDNSRIVEHTVPTSRRATNGELQGCTTEGQPRPR